MPRIFYLAAGRSVTGLRRPTPGGYTVAEQPTPRQLNVELPNDLTATYANFAIISHSPHEVVVDFAQMLPGMPKAKVQARACC